MSVVGVVALRRRARSAGSARCCRASTSRGRAARAPPRAPIGAVAARGRARWRRARRGTARGCRSRSIPYSAGHPRRHRRRRRDGGARRALRRHRPRQPLVPDQPARRGRDRASLADADAEALARSTRTGFVRRGRRPRVAVDARRPALRACCCRCCPRHPVLWGGLVAPLLWTGPDLRRRSASSIRRSTRASTGPGSSPRRSPSAWSPGFVVARTRAHRDHAARAARRARRRRGRRIDRVRRRVCVAAAGAVSALARGGLRSAAGRAAADADRRVRPSQVTDFATLYGENCAGCHGADGTPGAARAARTIPSTSRSSTTRRSGASTAERRSGHGDAGVRAERRRHAHRRADRHPRRAACARAGARAGRARRRRAAALRARRRATRTRGAQAYAAYCARCHGADGRGRRRRRLDRRRLLPRRW